MPFEYLPDSLPATPGAIVSGYGIRPTGRGYANVRALQQYGEWAALATTPNNIWANNFESHGRMLAASPTKIYELSIGTGGAYQSIDVSNGTYTEPTYVNATDQSNQTPWCFANYGKVVLASNRWNSVLQVQAVKGGTFSNVTGAPSLGCMTVWKNFVIGGNVGNYGAVTGTQDMMAWSALSDYTDWVPDATTMAGNQRLLDVPGRVIAVAPIGDALAIFKADAVWLAWQVDSTVIFAFQLQDGAQGINGDPNFPPPIVDIGKGLLYVTRDDIVLFDGANTTSLARGRVRNTLLDGHTDASWALNGTYITHNPAVGEVYFWDYGLIYNYNWDKWGSLPTGEEGTIVASMSATPFGIDCGTASGYINNARELVFKSDKLLYSRHPFAGGEDNTTWEDFSATLSEIGNNGFASTIRRAYLAFGPDNPTSTPTLDYARKTYLGQTAVADGAGTWDSSKYGFDLMRNAYWHQMTIGVPGSGNTVDFELIAAEYDIERDGKRVESGLRGL